MRENTTQPGRAPNQAFGALRRFARDQASARTPREHCETCGVELPDDHAHLFEPASRQLLCACTACSLTFGNQAGTPYRLVSRRVRLLQDFRLTDGQWDSLLIPVGMAFFFYNTPAKRMLAFYPSPAGPTESLLSLDSWEEVVRDNPLLAGMEPDVEALLVNRLNNQQEYFIAPIDKCYELVGLIRMHWRGLSGGQEVWDAINAFFAKLRQRADQPDA